MLLSPARRFFDMRTTKETAPRASVKRQAMSEVSLYFSLLKTNARERISISVSAKMLQNYYFFAIYGFCRKGIMLTTVEIKHRAGGIVFGKKVVFLFSIQGKYNSYEKF
jgi:hypothetical protein